MVYSTPGACVVTKPPPNVGIYTDPVKLVTSSISTPFKYEVAVFPPENTQVKLCQLFAGIADDTSIQFSLLVLLSPKILYGGPFCNQRAPPARSRNPPSTPRITALPV